MSRSSRFLGSSVGRKAIMAVTGLMLCGFLVVHLIGNIALLIADDGTVTATPGTPGAGEHFIAVVAAYAKIPALLYTMETILTALFLVHILLGITLWLGNRKARGSSYVVHRSEGGRTIGSSTMPYTGVCIIFVFLVVHLVNFRFGPSENPEGMYLLVDVTLKQWYWALFYGVALLGLMLHLSHGFQSAFQSLGANHPRWSPRIKIAGWAFALVVLAGFGILPVLFFVQGVSA